MKRRNKNILDYVDLIINYLRKRSGGTRELLEGYPYLNHHIQLCPDDWEKNMETINEAIGTKNRVTVGGGGKLIVRPFKSQEFWNCIGCIISTVTYDRK